MGELETGIPGLIVRFAAREEVGLILSYIRELADYEQLLDQVVATEQELEASLFDRARARVLLAEYEGEPAGFALFFYNYSTFLGREGLYLEDLYVRPAFRGRGLGRGLLSCLAQLAVQEGCGRLEWWCLDWNKPSIRFYRSVGAQPMDEWTVYRVDGERLTRLARLLEESGESL